MAGWFLERLPGVGTCGAGRGNFRTRPRGPCGGTLVPQNLRPGLGRLEYRTTDPWDCPQIFGLAPEGDTSGLPDSDVSGLSGPFPDLPKEDREDSPRLGPSLGETNPKLGEASSNLGDTSPRLGETFPMLGDALTLREASPKMEPDGRKLLL